MAYFEIGIYQPKTETNVGTLWRSAYQLGAAGIFTIGRRYKRQNSDTYKTYRHIPLRHYLTWEDFRHTLPMDALLVGVEMGGIPLNAFQHPKQCVYLLGSEDNGLSGVAMGACHRVISLGAINQLSYNVAVAGSIVMYDRMNGDK